MKTKTLLELITLSSSLYYIAKDAHLIDRFNELKSNGKDAEFDEDGNKLEFMDKIIQKTGQAKEELEQKIEEIVYKIYKKVNIAHLDEIKVLNEKLEKSDKALALLEARVNHLEMKK